LIPVCHFPIIQKSIYYSEIYFSSECNIYMIYSVPEKPKTFLPSFNEQDINMPLTKWNITKVDNNLLVSLYCPISNRKPLFYWPLSLPFRLSLRWPLAVLINATAMECIRKMIAAKHIICIINDLLATVCTLQKDCIKICKYYF